VSRQAVAQFDSSALAAERRFEQYHALYSAGADAIELGPQFEARMSGISLDRAVLYDRHLNDVGHERTPARCARDGMEHFTLTTLVAGEFHVDSAAGFVRLRPGESVLLDISRPMRNRAFHAHIITMAIARDRVFRATDIGLASLHGRRIDPHGGGLLFDHLRSLVHRAPSLADTRLIPLAGVTSAILGLSLGGDKDVRRTMAGIRLDEIASFVDGNLADPKFGVGSVLTRFALSRATLYRLFQAQGGFASYVRRQRLRQIRQRLSSGGNESSLADLAVAAGFKSESQASDAFLAAFGVRPGVYRRRAREESEFDRARRRLAEWTADLA
jgi:AraC-like DNA-binding protein